MYEVYKGIKKTVLSKFGSMFRYNMTRMHRKGKRIQEQLILNSSYWKVSERVSV